MTSVLITGVSTGIGLDAAVYLADQGWRVFGSVRREVDAQDLRQRLGDRFVPLVFDVTDDEAVRQAVDAVRRQVGDDGLGALVNNAGISVNGPMSLVPLERIRRQFEVNVIGAVRVTQAFLPLLGADKHRRHPPGRIVMISSTSGVLTYPFYGPYSASKHALEAIADALRRELLLYGIRVVVIQPGIINTPIWDKTEGIEDYFDSDYGEYLRPGLEGIEAVKRSGAPVREVSRLIGRALTAKTPRTRYVVVPGGWKGLIKQWWLPRLLPETWMDADVCRQR